MTVEMAATSSAVVDETKPSPYTLTTCEAIDFKFDVGIRRESDAFAFDLVGEEGCDDGEHARNDVVMSDCSQPRVQ
jgi:hypothetical protein